MGLDKMSYVSVNGLKSTNKLVLSIWFRVPQASIDAVAAVKSDNRPLKGYLPLVVMGKKGKSHGGVSTSEYTMPFTDSGYAITGLTGGVFIIDDSEPDAPGSFTGVTTYHTDVNIGAGFAPVSVTRTGTFTKSTVDGSTEPTDPSFIGINCNDPKKPTLFVNFESAKPATASNLYYGYSVSTQTSTGNDGFAFNQGVISGSYHYYVLPIDDLGDISFASTVVPVNYPDGTSEYALRAWSELSVPQATGNIYSDTVAVTADHWHHLLVSVNFKTVATHGDGPTASSWPNVAAGGFVDSAAQIYVALDDVNYTGYDLSSDWTGGGPNDVITDGAFAVAGSPAATLNDGAGNSIVESPPTYSLKDPTIALSGAAAGMPATAEFVNSIHVCEMGAMQMYLGTHVDPASKDIRRLFIKEPNTQGVQRPQQMGVASKYFGRDPDVHFFSVSQWQGKDQNDPANAVGEIDPYKPAPNLGGDQGQ